MTQGAGRAGPPGGRPAGRVAIVTGAGDGNGVAWAPDLDGEETPDA